MTIITLKFQNSPISFISMTVNSEVDATLSQHHTPVHHDILPVFN